MRQCECGGEFMEEFTSSKSSSLVCTRCGKRIDVSKSDSDLEVIEL